MMISAFSKKLDKAQKNYSITDRELLAIVKACDHYRHYLVGKEFEIWTDHKALTYMQKATNPSPRLLRWALKLQEFSFRIKHIKGEENAADGLSRPPDQLRVISRTVKDKIEEQDKKQILKEYHIESGHGSTNNMKFLLKSKYHWEGIYKDIEEYVRSCEVCQQGGNHKINTKNRIIKTSRPNELWELDTID